VSLPGSQPQSQLEYDIVVADQTVPGDILPNPVQHGESRASSVPAGGRIELKRRVSPAIHEVEIGSDSAGRTDLGFCQNVCQIQGSSALRFKAIDVICSTFLEDNTYSDSAIADVDRIIPRASVDSTATSSNGIISASSKNEHARCC
jgi:hypothetical protein